MVPRCVDLHIHTTFSDGLLNPCQVVAEANKKGMAAIGITDHDTMRGVACAETAGKKYGLEIIPGVELSTSYEDKEPHLLGYYCDPENPQLHKILKDVSTSRHERMVKMVDKLKNLGIDIQIEEVLEKARGDMLGRPHLALVICQKGYCRTPAEVFAKYIGNNCPAYVERYRLSLQEALNLVRGAGGIPVLAHPGLYKADELIPSMVRMGLLGIEAFHPEHRIIDRCRYLKMAGKYNLLITGGSDYHGKDMGSSGFIGTVRLDYKYLDKLKELKSVLFK
ncbi:MAG: PHP domain-containing protein [Dethiobacter sp.]|jgi:predicted metal-dependent phosphoesterase TrpH|nr:MAG: PHP domain-containing protein [Dethiobacter sp.]